MKKSWIVFGTVALGVLGACSADGGDGAKPPAIETDIHTQSGSCGHGIKSCKASEVGQPCDPNDLGVLCSAQSNGHYCCLAYAP